MAASAYGDADVALITAFVEELSQRRHDSGQDRTVE
jgi:hypothetical protein